MDKSIEELINKFENKKEFRAVKLRTRESFREDQAALESRLSRRIKPRQDNGMLNGDSKTGAANGLADNAEGNVHLDGLAENAEVNGSLSRLESIVLDIEREKEDEKVRKNSVDKFVVLDLEQKRSRISSLDNNVFLDEDRNHVSNGFGQGVAETSLINKRNGSAHIPNGHENGVNENTQNNVQWVSGQSGELVSPVLADPALQTIFKTGNENTAGPSTLITRPKITAQARAAMTPEPRLKSLKGIYQKNPKLTSSSTEHLDNLSLKGFRPQGQKIEYNQVSVPPVPSAEVTSLPADGNLSTFSPEHMVTVFRLLNIPEERVYKLHKYKVDGKRFALFSDAELEDMGMNNPIVRYFRDRSGQRLRKKPPKFML